MTLRSTLPLPQSFRPEYLEYYGILPLEVAEGVLRVAAAREPSQEVREDLERTFSARIEVLAVPQEEIVASVRSLFSSAESTDALVRSLDGAYDVEAGPEAFEADARDLANQPPVVRYVNLLIREAFEAKASDIHVEATERGPIVRFRIDGVLTAATAPPLSIQSAVVSRLKLIANLDIAERRVPQDGRIRIRLEERDLDLRVSTVPTLFGESIVLRLLDHGSRPAGLDALGMPEGVRLRFVQAALKPHGIILATGPTGSGKTTTLYSALKLRDSTREKIITIEDPIEYRLAGITQVPVNVKAGMTFAAGLRSILRQDPDVVMVGEMRDAETAHVAVQAAMTGHLVFSTLHTNDATTAITRLVDLGVEPYMIAATLQCVLAQRLVRRVCPLCAQWGPADREGPLTTGIRRMRMGRGCDSCRHTGFSGRLGIFELLDVTEAVRRQISDQPDANEVRRLAQHEGMCELVADGYAKVLDGQTTLTEVTRAVQS